MKKGIPENEKDARDKQRRAEGRRGAEGGTEPEKVEGTRTRVRKSRI
jgi:hypothetical protein